MIHLLAPRSLRRLTPPLLLAASHVLIACSDGLTGPNNSTETGNPPVLDRDSISLDLEGSGLGTIVGGPGAVTPAEGTVSAVELRTGEVFRGEVQADGSFLIEVPGDGIFYVVNGDHVDLPQVLLQAARDPDSVVVLGDASIEDTVAALGLTCFQQQLRAEGAVGTLLAETDYSCSADADCVLVSADSRCARSCGYSAVNGGQREAFESTIASLPDEVCPAYADGGECSPQPLSCGEETGQPVARCRAGGCVVENSELEDVCGGPQVALSWRKYAEGSDPERATAYDFAGLTYGGLQRVDAAGTRCLSELALCDGSGQEQKDIEIRRAVAHPDVQTVLMGGDQVIAADAASPRMQIDIGYSVAALVRVDLPLCTSCQVAPGVLALAELLDELGEQATWSSCYRAE